MAAPWICKFSSSPDIQFLEGSLRKLIVKLCACSLVAILDLSRGQFWRWKSNRAMTVSKKMGRKEAIVNYHFNRGTIYEPRDEESGRKINSQITKTHTARFSSDFAMPICLRDSGANYFSPCFANLFVAQEFRDFAL